MVSIRDTESRPGKQLSALALFFSGRDGLRNRRPPADLPTAHSLPRLNHDDDDALHPGKDSRRSRPLFDILHRVLVSDIRHMALVRSRVDCGVGDIARPLQVCSVAHILGYL